MAKDGLQVCGRFLGRARRRLLRAKKACKEVFLYARCHVSIVAWIVPLIVAHEHSFVYLPLEGSKGTAAAEAGRVTELFFNAK